MKEKLKKINWGLIANVLKASLIGVIVSIILVLIFAFVLKFVDLNGTAIALVDQIIKIISIFIAVLAINKFAPNSLLVKGLIVGAVYCILTFFVFSILNGGVSFSAGILNDLAFSALVGGVSAIIVNIIAKKQ